MNEFETSLRKIANRMGLFGTVSVCANFDNSAVRVGYSFCGRPQKRIVEIQFGAMASLMSMCELEAIIVHEFAHIIAGHTSKLGFRSLHVIHKLPPSPARTFITNLIVATLRCKSFWLGRQQEFSADRIACSNVPSLSFACVLVKSAAFENAIDDLWRQGKIGGYAPVFESKSIQLKSQCAYGLSFLEIIQVISDTFEMNRSAFLSCSKMAKQLDGSTRDHPSNRERLERIGLEWDAAEDKCVFESEQRLDFGAFKEWICEPNNKIILKKAKSGKSGHF